MHKLSIALATLLMLAGATAAQSGCETTEPTLTLETPVGTYYVVNDLCQPGCLFSIWIYQETNGEPGLQRGDELCGDDCCQSWEPDTIVF